MTKSTVWKKHGTIIRMMGWILITVILFSAFGILTETDHDCTGEDCLICACLRHCISILRGFSFWLLSSFFCVFSGAVILFPVLFHVAVLRAKTPVVSKVRLDQ